MTPIKKVTGFTGAFCVAAAGGLIADQAGVPAAFILGGTLAVALYCLCGGPVYLPVSVRNAVFCIIGVTMGATVTPDVLTVAVRWPFSFLMLIVSVVLITVLSKEVLVRFSGYRRNSAWLAASPGHLSYVLGLGLSLGKGVPGDIDRITVAQSIRVLSLTLSVPFLITALVAVPLAGSGSGAGEGIRAAVPGPGDPLLMDPVYIVLVPAGAGLAGWVFNRLKLPAAFLLGGLSVSAVTHISGLTPGGMPDYLTVPGFLIMGVLIGSRFYGISLTALRRALWSGVVITLIAVTVAVSFAGLVWFTLDLPFAQAMLAFTPGALEVIGALAVALDAEPAYVAAHHVLRLLVITVMMPVLVRR